MKEAYVWISDFLIGRFSETDDGETCFEYSMEAKSPISLSLPLDDSWKPDAPRLFLDGLLPDNEAERDAMRRALEAKSIDPLDLLVAVDSTGGLVFSKGPDLDDVRGLKRHAARNQDIETKIYNLAKNRGSWQADDGRSRFSLAGTQSKFSLARYKGRWLWPNAKYPSTHIIKPADFLHPEVNINEHAMMTLSSLCGIKTAVSYLVSFGGQEAYVTDRFDRKLNQDWTVERLHIEDFAQALGIPKSNKYHVTVKDVIKLFSGLATKRELISDWVPQLAFNTIVGNCDAHAKNYSIYMPVEGDPSLCPLYDCVCTKYWPEFSEDLAMSINGKRNAADISLDDWAAEAAVDDIDQIDVIETVANVAIRVARNIDGVLRDLPVEVSEKIHDVLVENNMSLFTQLGLLDSQGKLLKEPVVDIIEHIVYPSEMQVGTLSGRIVETREEDSERVRVCFHDGISTKYGQDLSNSYVLVETENIDVDGNIT